MSSKCNNYHDSQVSNSEFQHAKESKCQIKEFSKSSDDQFVKKRVECKPINSKFKVKKEKVGPKAQFIQMVKYKDHQDITNKLICHFIHQSCTP